MKRLAFFAVIAAAGLGALTLAARPGVRAQAALNPSAISEARQTLSRARGEALRARERAAILDGQARSALLASEKATLGAAALAARVQQAEAALAAAGADLVLVSEKRRSLATRLAQENAPIGRVLAALQTQIRRPPVLQMLQPGSISDAVHLRAVLLAVEPQLRRRTSALRSELTQARSLERDALRLTQQHRNLQGDLLARRSELAAVSAAERLKARRASSAADREAERAFAVAENTRDLTALVRALEAGSSGASAKSGAPRASAAGMATGSAADSAAPHRMPVQGRLAAVQLSPRKGLTLEPRPSALVVAPGPGRVAFAGAYRGFGNIVILEHAGGWTSLLTGLADARVAVGQTLVAGSPLGQAAARDPRITIELRRSGTPVDASTQLR